MYKNPLNTSSTDHQRSGVPAREGQRQQEDHPQRPEARQHSTNPRLPRTLERLWRRHRRHTNRKQSGRGGAGSESAAHEIFHAARPMRKPRGFTEKVPRRVWAGRGRFRHRRESRPQVSDVLAAVRRPVRG